jgi:hypothetical protein
LYVGITYIAAQTLQPQTASYGFGFLSSMRL